MIANMSFMSKLRRRNEDATQPERSGQREWYEYFRDILYIFVIFLVVYTLLFRIVQVDGPSMNDTLYDGDRLLLVSNLIYKNPQQGDIIVASKDSFRNGECIIKRVIATEGQWVDIDFVAGIVYVGDSKDAMQPLQEDYILNATHMKEGVNFPLQVDSGCVFVMGDNRMNSKDSRSPEIGLIDCREILGKALLLLIPSDPDGVNGPQKADWSRIGWLG